ncbi:MAG TPA: D-glycero-beta-D-manno-heptose-7-phosphate kinase, partial [Vicinamibacteria bacterium]|nr:D-glycero-beta-D-manno-heptose-7-phosphate kinase [Vicinamibacteria bacterium]
MLDEFLWGKVARISPEAPVPVVQVTGQSFHLGGAANVAGNLRALGGAAVLAGVVGDDGAADRLREALDRAGVVAHLLVDGERPTTLKTRIVAHSQQVVRADRERAEDIGEAMEDALVQRLRGEIEGCRALVISDYEKGVVTPRLLRKVLALARRRTIPVLVDPKLRHFALYKRVSIVTPNQGEAELATGVEVASEAGVEAAGRRILSMLGCGAVLVTRGEHGMSLVERGRRPVHIPTAARAVFDVTGAGDTVIASLALAVAAGARLAEAAVLANQAAGVVVGKVGTSEASPSEVLAAFGPRDA